MPSLVGSLTRTLFVGLTIVFLLMTLLVDLYGSRLLQAITNERLDYILSSQAENSSQLLWDMETGKIQTALKNIAQDKNISAARIVEIIGDKHTVLGQYGWDNIHENANIISAPILHAYNGGDLRLLGTLEVAVDYQNIEQQIFGIIVGTSVLFGGLFLLLGIMVYYFLRRSIDPITQLSSSLIDADYFTHKIEKIPSKAREINDLFDTLIKMQKIMQRQTLEIQEQKAMLDTIINKMPLGMFVEDLTQDGTLVITNDMFRRLFGLDGIPCEGKTLKHLIPSRDAKLMDEMNQGLLKGHTILETDAHMTGNKQNKFIGRIIKTPILDETGRVVLIVSMVQDVTEQVEAQNNLLVAKEAAEKANAAKSEFLANMSHELRTPMNSIMGLASLVIEDDVPAVERKEMLETVLKSSNILLNILNDILDLSKIEAGGVNLEAIPFDLKDQVVSIVNTLKPLASSKAVSITSSWNSPLLPVVLGDPTRFTRVITNLGSNAVKFTHEGEINLSFNIKEAGADQIIFTCAVKDTGIGIPEDKIEYIFDKFAQADDTITRQYGGTGLGLAITQQIVELMGGEISVESEVGHGSTFTIEIPFKTVEREIHHKNQQEERNDKNGDANTDRRPIGEAVILVAEDHEMNQMMMRKLLTRLKVKDFDIMEDGQKACDMYKQKDYDLIIMDCHMPNMNGYDATKALREFEQSSGKKPVTILAMTADAMAGTKDKCLEAGMDDYVSKPIKPEELSRVLKQWFVV